MTRWGSPAAEAKSGRDGYRLDRSFWESFPFGEQKLRGELNEISDRIRADPSAPSSMRYE
jgi:hypothetical protein